MRMTGVLLIAVGAAGVSGVLGLVAGSWLQRALYQMYPPFSTLTGRVEAPDDVTLEGVRILASRDGRLVTSGEVEADGTFRLSIPREGLVDLQAFRGPGGYQYLSETRSRNVRSVGPWEGVVRGLHPWSRNVTVRLAPQTRGPLSIRVLGPDGAPAVGARVTLSSLCDEFFETADANGEAAFVDVPVRRWRAIARPPWSEDRKLVFTRREIDSSILRTELTLPRGVPIKIRIAGKIPADVYLETSILWGLWAEGYWAPPWKPDADGTMTLMVSPEQESFSVVAHEYLVHERDHTVTRRFAAGAIPVRPGAELVLTAIGQD